MYTLLLVLLILDALVLGAAILLQAGKGGGLSANFGGASSSADSVIGTRQAGNLLTKASWWCGGIFREVSPACERNAGRLYGYAYFFFTRMFRFGFGLQLLDL